MALQTGDLFSLPHYEYGEAYYGSLAGMRFRVAREPLEDVHSKSAEVRADAVLRAEAWPEPDSWRAAKDESKIRRDFPFTQEGLDEVLQWLNETHDEHEALWPAP